MHPKAHLTACGEEVRELNTRLYQVQSQLLSCSPREKKRLRREAQALEADLLKAFSFRTVSVALASLEVTFTLARICLQVRYRLEATRDYLQSIQGPTTVILTLTLTLTTRCLFP